MVLGPCSGAIRIIGGCRQLQLLGRSWKALPVVPGSKGTREFGSLGGSQKNGVVGLIDQLARLNLAPDCSSNSGQFGGNAAAIRTLRKGGQPTGMVDPTPLPKIKAPVITNITTYIIPGANNSDNILEDPVPSLRISVPVQDKPGNKVEKQAARLVVIRRIKMNKHKLRKLRKKMHYKWAKIKERRYIRREKAYMDEKMAMITAAMKFDAKDYVADVIRKAKEEPLPRKWTNPIMPDWFREQEMEKEARLKRYQKVVNMYLNKGIKIKID